MKNTFILILSILLLASCDEAGGNDRTVATEYMKAIARETNEKGKLPAKVNEYTIAEKVTFDVNSNVLTYNYKLYTDIYSKSEWQRMLRDVEVEQIQNARSLHSNNKFYQLLKVTINSVYLDFDGNEIYSFKIKPEQYL